jgi:hypothetical protein
MKLQTKIYGVFFTLFDTVCYGKMVVLPVSNALEWDLRWYSNINYNKTNKKMYKHSDYILYYIQCIMYKLFLLYWSITDL